MKDRLRYLFGDDALASVDDLDFEEYDNRRELAERLVPPTNHNQGQRGTLIYAILISQILDDDPPQAWQTAQRLIDAGLETPNVLMQMGMAYSEGLLDSIEHATPRDDAAYVERLEHLPLPDDDEIARVILAIARRSPGISHDEILEQACAELGPEPAGVIETMVDQLLHALMAGPLHWLAVDDKIVVVPDVVDNTVFTHRFNETEAAMGIITSALNLGALRRFEDLGLEDDTEIERFSVEEFHQAWTGPDGWLDDFTPGDLLAITATTNFGADGLDLLDATVAIAKLTDEPAMTPELVALVRDAYDRIVDATDVPVTGDELAYTLLFEHPEVFTSPQPPLMAICEAAGLGQYGSRVAHDEAIWREGLVEERIADIHSLTADPELQATLTNAVAVLDDPTAIDAEVRDALTECADPDALYLLADVLFSHNLSLNDAEATDNPYDLGNLFTLVERAIGAAHSQKQRAVAHYLACVLYERAAAPELAESHLEQALGAQPRLGPIVERAGWYRFDRGDAKGAVRLWSQLHQPPAAMGTAQQFAGPSSTGPKLGRNDPCWCGSGQKFKHCHQHQTDTPALPDRVGWLARKASL